MPDIGRGKTSIVFTTLLFFVFPSCVQAVVCPLGDINGNCRVDMEDVQMLVDHWLDPLCSAPDCRADLVPGSGVNLLDYVQLANNNDKTGVPVVISEFMADNEGSFNTLMDGQWEHPDWIEIYNPSDVTVDLGGCFLTDKPGDKTKWPIPPGTILPGGGYLIIFASSQNDAEYPVLDDLGYWHTNFSLNNGGEYVALVLPNGSTVEFQYPISYPEPDKYAQQYVGWSYGLSQDLLGEGYIYPATPGKPNTSTPVSDPIKNIVISEIMYHPYHSLEVPVEPEPVLREFIEIYNRGIASVDLTGWRFANGVDFTFPGVTLDPNQYLVIAADVTSFLQAYPQVNPAKVVGGWTGKLSNSGEDIDLVDETGLRMDRVEYADEGDWAVRELGPVDNLHRGWIWSDDHDGAGKSLELINISVSNEYGQNWAASTAVGGSPGGANSVAAGDIAPLILDMEHNPIIPRAIDPVTVTARIIDELSSGITATLYYRVDTSTYINEDTYPTHVPAAYTTVTMHDDGLHNDGEAGNGVYGAEIPAQADGTIIELYVEVSDSGANVRTWPAASDMSSIGAGMQQVTNLLYQVNDSYDPNAKWSAESNPIFYLIMTEAERARLADIGDDWSDERYSNAQMNGTFISIDGVEMKKRYNVGFRNRGESSRGQPPNNYRVNFRHDDKWNNITAIKINSKYTYLQVVGCLIFRMAGILSAEASAVDVRVNGTNLALTDQARMYGAYAYLEEYDGDWAENHVPGDSGGNLYKAAYAGGWNADLTYLGTDPADYEAVGYFKQTNESEYDWTDLFDLTNVLDNEPDITYVAEVNRVINSQQWVRWFALNSLLGNNENGLATGVGEDYWIYRGMDDTRFQLLAHDLDTILHVAHDIPAIDRSIFYIADRGYMPLLDRFIKHPEFVREYYAQFMDLIETTCAAENFDPLMDEVLGDWLPTALVNEIKQKMAERITNVLGQIPLDFTISSSLSTVNGFYHTTSGVTSLSGTANSIETYAVRINGVMADNWSVLTGDWDIGNSIALNPGINRVIVETFDDPDGTGNILESGYVDIWYDDRNESLASGTIASNTTWDRASGPWHVTGNITIPAGITLTIEAGTTVFFDAGTGITVNGRLVAEGTPYERIRLTKVPGGANWAGLSFSNTLEDSRLTCLDHDYGDSKGNSLNVSYAKIYIDNITWGGTTDRNVLEMFHPSIEIRNSYIPGVNNEPIHGTWVENNEYVIFKGCVIDTGIGANDIIDWESGDRDTGARFMLINNTFLGGGDDGADLDATDAYVEGNIFTNFHILGSDTTANAVASGQAYSSDPHDGELVIIRNIFYDVDHAVLLKEEASGTISNNVFVDATDAAVQFAENPSRNFHGPGAGANMDGNIFRGYGTMPIKYLTIQDLPYTWTTDPIVSVNNSIITDEAFPGSENLTGSGNINVDPLFVDETVDFHLLTNSPAIGAGVNGVDIGRYIPAGASVSGEPYAITHRTDATLTVGGPAITDYKYRLMDNDGWVDDWSGEIPVATPISLTGLTDGLTYTVYVLGKNTEGLWPGDLNNLLPADPAGNASRSWTVNTTCQHLVINEVLAGNRTAVDHEGSYPDIIELYYNGPATLDLSNMSITDDLLEPTKFVFTAGTTIDPGNYLVLYDDANMLTSGIHLNFSIDADGEGVYLYDTPANGGGLIDSVEFGQQLEDLSVGRVGPEQKWMLTQPTLGSANIAEPAGTPYTLKINEWLAAGKVLFDDDYIEIYNPHGAPVDLGGMYLTDNPVTEPNKHQITPLSFAAGEGFIVFRADDNNRAGHVDFRLSANRGMIGLYDGALNEIDKVIFGPQTTDVSRGRSPQDGGSTFAFFNFPTPGMPNATSGPEPITLELISIGADVRYYVPTDSTDQDTWMQWGYGNLGGWQSDVTLLGFGDVFGLGGAWRAFNDCIRAADDATADNVTQWTVNNNNPGSLRTGKLINFYTGNDFQMPTVTFTMGPAGVQSGSTGSGNPAPATPAYDIFHNEQGWIVDFDDDLLYYGDLGWWIKIEFSDLNPTSQYSFVGTAIRNANYPGRKSLFTISGHDGATNNSSNGILEKNGDITKLLAGNNQAAGYVVRWDNILPGADGSFIIQAEAAADSDEGGRKAYPFGGFMFEGGAVENELENQMLGANSSLWTRIEFNLDEDPIELTALTLKMRHDDAFVAYLNGNEVARSNFTGTPLWNSAADGNRDNSLAADFETFDISGYINDLRQGTNVLAVQIMNESVNDLNLLFLPELTAVQDPNDEVISYDDAIDLLNGLRITEIMYHPQDEVVHPDAEFIELQNVGPVDLNLTGVRFTQGIDYTFPAMILPAGDYVVIVKDKTIFEVQYGMVPEVIGEYVGSLSNDGEDIVLNLSAPLQAAILRFSYNDVWYPMTDGFGRSLVIREPTAPAANWDEKYGWQAGDVLHGTPGF